MPMILAHSFGPRFTGPHAAALGVPHIVSSRVVGDDSRLRTNSLLYESQQQRKLHTKLQTRNEATSNRSKIIFPSFSHQGSFCAYPIER